MLLPFGQQLMFRHIIDDGSWLTSKGERVEAGEGIKRYTDDPTFQKFYLGTDREYANNNESRKALVNELAGFFVDRRSNTLFLGQIDRIQNERFT